MGDLQSQILYYGKNIFWKEEFSDKSILCGGVAVDPVPSPATKPLSLTFIGPQ